MSRSANVRVFMKSGNHFDLKLKSWEFKSSFGGMKQFSWETYEDTLPLPIHIDLNEVEAIVRMS